MKAASKGHIEIMRLLLEAKVNPNEIRIPHIDETNALMVAASENQLEAIKLLLKYKADVRNNTLVTVTTRHLITRLDATFNSQVNLNNFQYTCC